MVWHSHEYLISYFPFSSRSFCFTVSEQHFVNQCIQLKLSSSKRIWFLTHMSTLLNWRNLASICFFLGGVLFVFLRFLEFLSLMQTCNQSWRGRFLRNWTLHLRYWQKTVLNKQICPLNNTGYPLLRHS